MLMIVPPIEIRVVIEKLAAHVAKNGSALEVKILEKERGNARFSFLAQSDPYNEYYCSRKLFYAQADPLSIDNILADSAVLAEAQRLRTHAYPNLLGSNLSMQPEEYIRHEYYTGDLSVAPEDYALILYTAMHVVLYGDAFEAALCAREAQNPQFSFLRSVSGPLRNAYTDALRQYRLVVSKSSSVYGELASKSTSVLLNRAQLLAQKSESASSSLSTSDDLLRSRVNEINWDSFSIVGSVDFSRLPSHLPAPLSLESVSRLTTLQRQALFNGQFIDASASVSVRLVDALNLEFEAVAAEPLEQSLITRIGADALSDAANIASSSQFAASYEKEATQEPQIRNKFVSPKAQKPSGASRVQCPICNGTFDVNEIAEHMRVEALDPKWHDQRQKYLSKHAGTNLATTDNEVLQALEAMHERRAPRADAPVAGPEQRPLSRERKKRN